VCSMFFDNVSCIYSDVVYMSLHIPGSVCVGVTLWFGYGGVVSIYTTSEYIQETLSNSILHTKNTQ